MFNFNNIYINNWYSVVGPYEKNNIKKYNLGFDDYYFGEKTIEQAEIKMQKITLDYLTSLVKADIVLGSDILDQMIISNLSMLNRNIPYLGIYSACASTTAGMIILASFIQSKNINKGLFITSSHSLNAEKQYRFPIEYGAPKPRRATLTATGCVGFSVSTQKSNIKIVNGTFGCVIDSYVKDAYNMGAVMAPGAVDTLLKHLTYTKTTIDNYDLILTGDLGKVGASIFKELLKKKGYKITNHMDAGANLYKNIDYAGASGPAALPLILFNNVIYNKKYKKILLLATGALHSKLLVNQSKTIPTVTHAVTLEVIS